MGAYLAHPFRYRFKTWKFPARVPTGPNDGYPTCRPYIIVQTIWQGVDITSPPPPPPPPPIHPLDHYLLILGILGMTTKKGLTSPSILLLWWTRNTWSHNNYLVYPHQAIVLFAYLSRHRNNAQIPNKILRQNWHICGIVVVPMPCQR